MVNICQVLAEIFLYTKTLKVIHKFSCWCCSAQQKNAPKTSVSKLFLKNIVSTKVFVPNKVFVKKKLVPKKFYQNILVSKKSTKTLVPSLLVMPKKIGLKVVDKRHFITQRNEEWHTVLTGLCAMGILEHSRTF